MGSAPCGRAHRRPGSGGSAAAASRALARRGGKADEARRSPPRRRTGSAFSCHWPDPPHSATRASSGDPFDPSRRRGPRERLGDQAQLRDHALFAAGEQAGRTRGRWASDQSARPTREQGLVAPGGGCLGLSRSRGCIGTRQPKAIRSSRERVIVEILAVERLVRPVGWRGPQRCAGRIHASNVASGRVFPRRDAGIQARITPGSHCSVGEGTRSIKKGLSEPGDHHGLPAFGGLHTGLRADRSSPCCAPFLLIEHAAMTPDCRCSSKAV